MTGRTRATLGALMFTSVVSFAAGALWLNSLIESQGPTATPTLLPERPEPQPYNLPLQYAQDVIYWCDKEGVPVWIAARLFSWESGFNADYHSRRNDNGSYDDGIAALNSYSLAYFSAKYNEAQPIDPHDPATAIKVGIMFLADLYRATGDWRLTAGAYNAGLGTPPSKWRPTTVRHVKAVLGETR